MSVSLNSYALNLYMYVLINNVYYLTASQIFNPIQGRQMMVIRKQEAHIVKRGQFPGYFFYFIPKLNVPARIGWNQTLGPSPSFDAPYPTCLNTINVVDKWFSRHYLFQGRTQAGARRACAP